VLADEEGRHGDVDPGRRYGCHSDMISLVETNYYYSCVLDRTSFSLSRNDERFLWEGIN
jgi:hypothetical protein